MYASVREDNLLSALPFHIRHEFQRCILMCRWMDDLVHVVRSSLSAEARHYLGYFQQAHSYSRWLQLVRTYDSSAFGFRWYNRRGVLLVAQDEKWIPSFDRKPVCGAISYTVYHGQQFDTRQMCVGVLKGYILRMLDCSNRQEKQMLLSLQRLVIEMQSAKHDSRHILEAINGAERQALLKMSSVRDVLSWSPKQRHSFCLLYDLSYRLEESNARRAAALRGCLDGAR